MALRLRLRGPAGLQHTINMSTTTALADLRKKAASTFGIVESELEMLTGFPPTLCFAESNTLLDGLVKNGDTVIVRQGTGRPATQAMSAEAFSARKSRASPMLQPRIAPVQAPIAPRSIKRHVNLFWKVAVDDALCLKAVELPHQCKFLEQVYDLHVCLLFFGGRDEATAAEHEGLSLKQFRHIHCTLSANAGKRVRIVAHSICVHREVVFAMVTLPHDLLHHQGRGTITPFLKFRVRPGAPGNIVRSVLAQGTGFTQKPLPEPLSMSGTIQLETGVPLHLSQFGKKIHLAEEVQGQRVHVKKHSSMNCAVITFSSCAIRDSVLQRCFNMGSVWVHGIPLDVKPHVPKNFDSSRGDIPESLFVAWEHGGHNSIHCEDLQWFFDQQAGASMSGSSLDENSQVAKELLKSKLELDASLVLDGGNMTELDDVLVLRLTRMARSAEVTAILLGSDVLEECRQRMTAAGYDITPQWAGGAKLFVPLEQEQVEAIVTLQHFHIVAYSSDVERIKQALSTMSCRTRPKLVQEQLLFPHEDEEPFVVECTLRTHSSFGFPAYIHSSMS